MTKHTPGPWFISSRFYIHNKPTKFDAQGARIGETPQRIATVESMVSDGSAESNAHLMVAAPDLLEALKDAENKIAELCRTINRLAGFTKNRVEDYTEKLRAAIAKAEAQS